MARVLVIPDTHLKTWVIDKGMELADKLFCDRVVLLGDYFDDWDAIDVSYRNMIDYLKNLMRKNPGRIIPLLGNHELSYLGHKCSGYHHYVAPEVKSFLENDNRFLWCYAEDCVLYSHAGFTREWMVRNKLMPLHVLKYHFGKINGARVCEERFGDLKSLDQLAQCGPARGGSSPFSSPVWADMDELLADNIGTFIQVVGHTPVQQIEFFNHCYFTDVYSNDNVSDEYLLVVDGEPKIVHYNELILGEVNV